MRGQSQPRGLALLIDQRPAQGREVAAQKRAFALHLLRRIGRACFARLQVRALLLSKVAPPCGGKPALRILACRAAPRGTLVRQRFSRATRCLSLGQSCHATPHSEERARRTEPTAWN